MAWRLRLDRGTYNEISCFTIERFSILTKRVFFSLRNDTSILNNMIVKNIYSKQVLDCSETCLRSQKVQYDIILSHSIVSMSFDLWIVCAYRSHNSIWHYCLFLYMIIHPTVLPIEFHSNRIETNVCIHFYISNDVNFLHEFITTRLSSNYFNELVWLRFSSKFQRDHLFRPTYANCIPFVIHKSMAMVFKYCRGKKR